MHQASFHCPQCQQMRLFQAKPMSHTAHILASVFLCGLWLPIWILLAVTYKETWRCAFCGFSDGVNYLADPHRRAREQAAGYDAQVRNQAIRDEAAELAPADRIKYYLGVYQKEVVGVGLICMVLAAFVMFAAVKEQLSPAAPATNQTRAFASTPTPVPTATPKPKSAKEIEAENLKKRQLFAQLQERAMLDKGFDFELTLQGKKQDHLRVKYILVSRVFVHQFQQNYPEFFSGLRDLGFKKLTFTDGYDDSWVFDL